MKRLQKKAAALAALVNRADYECRLDSRINSSEIENRYNAILKQKELFVQRKRKRQIRTIDVRPFIDHFQLMENGFQVRTTMQDSKSIRISELLSLMFPDSDYIAKTALVHRAALWVQEGQNLMHPMDVAVLSEQKI